MRNKIVSFALCSRILLFASQVLFNFVIPDHDAKAFNPPNIHKKHWLDHYAEIVFEGFKRWDGVYFHHVAEHGYTYENTLVFFPMFPLIVRVLANTVFLPLQLIISYNLVLTIAAFVLNLVVFIKSALVLYDLSLFVLKDETLALKAAQLYSINPASIFFSAVYSETMFAYFAFKAMLFIEKKRFIRSSLLFGLSGLTRSNGLVNIGFIIYQKFIDAFYVLKSVKNTKFINKRSRLLAVITYLLLILGHLAIQVAFAVIPFLLYQYYAYTVFCDKNASYKDLPTHILNYGNSQKYKMPHTGLSSWCYDTYPISYTYVQDHHWDVGFMRYWQYKQIPNFLLAAPIILLSAAAVVSFLRSNFVFSMTLGLYKPEEEVMYYKKTDHVQKIVGFGQQCVYVYVVHLAFLLVFGVFFMHIQVLTRFICSSSPVVYWFIAHITTPADRLKPHNFGKDNGYKPPHMIELEQQKPKDTQHEHLNRAESEKNSSVNERNGVLTSSHQVKENGSMSQNEVTQSVDQESEDFVLSDLDDLYDWDSNSWLHKLIFIYFHLYYFVGIAAFVNFLPWT